MATIQAMVFGFGDLLLEAKHEDQSRDANTDTGTARLDKTWRNIETLQATGGS